MLYRIAFYTIAYLLVLASAIIFYLRTSLNIKEPTTVGPLLGQEETLSTILPNQALQSMKTAGFVLMFGGTILVVSATSFINWWEKTASQSIYDRLTKIYRFKVTATASNLTVTPESSATVALDEDAEDPRAELPEWVYKIYHRLTPSPSHRTLQYERIHASVNDEPAVIFAAPQEGKKLIEEASRAPLVLLQSENPAFKLYAVKSERLDMMTPEALAYAEEYFREVPKEQARYRWYIALISMVLGKPILFFLFSALAGTAEIRRHQLRREKLRRLLFGAHPPQWIQLPRAQLKTISLLSKFFRGKMTFLAQERTEGVHRTIYSVTPKQHYIALKPTNHFDIESPALSRGYVYTFFVDDILFGSQMTVFIPDLIAKSFGTAKQ